MYTKDHFFILAHESKEIDIKASIYCTDSYDGFEKLANNEVLKNAIIIDPWVYKATKLEKYIDHLEHTDLYGVKDFYDEQKRNLLENYSSFSIGRKYNDVRKSLEFNINEHRKILISLKDFINRLKTVSSTWYSGFKHSDRKGDSLEIVIEYLDNCVNNYIYDEPSEYKLFEIFKSILRILPIVRSSNIAPNNLSINNIDMTNSALGLFSNKVTNNNLRYEFEKIEDLSLQWIRDARHNSDRIKYQILLSKIANYDPNHSINEILPNFYENKDKYYQLVQKIVEE
ncbi:hypothetical protein [Francisella philomiragia]|uniref:hypothetical protein n=1 Tax=Francisella philomiragia TaxID=28110 RepID=UPI0035131EA5